MKKTGKSFSTDDFVAGVPYFIRYTESTKQDFLLSSIFEGETNKHQSELI